VAERFVAAATAMKNDGWWWTDPALTDKRIKRGILREMLSQRF
jgi:glutamate-1-semialdehyde 2,1-aminomutase